MYKLDYIKFYYKKKLKNHFLQFSLLSNYNIYQQVSHFDE